MLHRQSQRFRRTTGTDSTHDGDSLSGQWRRRQSYLPFERWAVGVDRTFECR